MTEQNTNKSSNEKPDISLTQDLISILWPSFLVGSLTTILFFTLFDPHQLGLISGFPELTRLGGYSIGFFSFWFLSAISSALTCYFRKPCHHLKNTNETAET